MAPSKLNPRKASALPGYRLRLLRQQLARRAANLLDPKWHEGGRRFPIFDPGMSTGQYIALFQDMTAVDSPSPRLLFDHRRGVPAPMLDPMVPEVVREVLP